MTVTELPASDIQTKHMTHACFIANFWDKHAPQERNYAFIAAKIRQSRDKAGGSALRLANCIWDLEYALKFPKNKTLKLREESSFARLCEEHRNTPASRRYFVWDAMEDFVPIRQTYIAQPAMALLEKEELILPERAKLVRVFFKLSYFLLREKPLKHMDDLAYLDKIIRLFLTVDPRRADMVDNMDTVANAIYTWLRWRDVGSGELHTRYMRYNNQMYSLLRGSNWLNQTVIGDAVSIFRDATQNAKNNRRFA